MDSLIVSSAIVVVLDGFVYTKMEGTNSVTGSWVELMIPMGPAKNFEIVEEPE